MLVLYHSWPNLTLLVSTFWTPYAHDLTHTSKCKYAYRHSTAQGSHSKSQTQQQNYKSFKFNQIDPIAAKKNFGADFVSKKKKIGFVRKPREKFFFANSDFFSLNSEFLRKCEILFLRPVNNLTFYEILCIYIIVFVLFNQIWALFSLFCARQPR